MLVVLRACGPSTPLRVTARNPGSLAKVWWFLAVTLSGVEGRDARSTISAKHHQREANSQTLNYLMTYALALDLTDDPALIAEYEAYHANMRPEIEATIRAAGITGMTLYRFGNRLFMLIETDDTFSFERKARMDAETPLVQEWERLMWTYQQAIPGSQPGEKWVLMHQIYDLPN